MLLDVLYCLQYIIVAFLSENYFFTFGEITFHAITDWPFCKVLNYMNCSITITFLSNRNNQSGVICIVEQRRVDSGSVYTSFMNILNKQGPLTLTCIVPLFTLIQSQATLLQTTRCLLSVRKLKYQFKIYGLSGGSLSLENSRSCLTVSKALLKSIANTLTASHPF